MIDPAAIEAIARAMCRAEGDKPDDLSYSTESASAPMWHFYRITATEWLAAFEAYAKFMRERTMG